MLLPLSMPDVSIPATGPLSPVVVDSLNEKLSNTQLAGSRERTGRAPAGRSRPTPGFTEGFVLFPATILSQYGPGPDQRAFA